MLENTELLENPAEYPLESERLSLFMIFLIPFIIGAVSIAALPGANYVVVGIGAVCAAGFAIGSLRGNIVFPPETWLFSGFLMWSSLGFIVARVLSMVATTIFTLLQLYVMVIIIIHFCTSTKAARYLLLAVLTGCFIVGLSAYLSGEYRRVAEVAFEQASGFALNANAFSMILVYASAIVLYFFKTSKTLILKVIFTVGIIGIALLIIASGSRSGFISFVILSVVWFLFSYGREVLNRPGTVIIMFIVLLFGLLILFSSLSNTTMGKRLEQMRGGGYGSASISERRELIQKGVFLILTHPLLGIGMSQFVVVSGYNLYSHNNYIEVFCGAGIPGGILFFSIYLVLWLRLRRLGKIVTDPKSKELVGMAKALLIMIFISNMSVICYYDKLHWIVMAILIGWSYHFERNIKVVIETEPVDNVRTISILPY